MTAGQKIGWLFLSVFLPYLTRKLASFASNRDTPFWRGV